MNFIASKQNRGLVDDSLKYWENGEYFQCWYPIARSEEVTADKSLGKEFLNTRVILYRDSQGTAVVQGAYCPHLGADLSGGDICEGKIRCPYHHWSFHADGQIADIPSGDPVPRRVRVATYPTREEWGLVWAFNGDTPLCELPGVPGPNASDVVFRTISRPEQPVECWIPTSNAVDFQHLRVLHHLPDIMTPEALDVGPHTLAYGVPEQMNFSRLTGCNTFVSRNLRFGCDSFVMFTSTALSPGRVAPFFIVGYIRDGLNAPQSEAEADALLNRMEAEIGVLYEEDASILDTIRFRMRGNAALVKADRHLGTFLEFIDKLPRARPLDT